MSYIASCIDIKNMISNKILFLLCRQRELFTERFNEVKFDERLQLLYITIQEGKFWIVK